MAGLLGELGYPATPERVRDRLGRPGERLLLAELDGQPVGLLSLTVLHHVTHARPLARVVAMVVRARARRGGVGRALMERAEALARAAGCEGVELTSANSPERE
ncbi:MAG TPA: GNAT family N-acetyltransferase, partial [Candidatus Dormibacteraeota bacterium]|nr:GNAT family N-acetyltransferase [Candidatus Dormibacteraeota bacterium]